MSITEFSSARGIRLGPPVSQFSEANLAAVLAARDAYFSSNPSKLALYDADTNLLIRLSYLGAGDIPQTTYQIRMGGSWIDYTAVVAGPPGDAASLDGVPINEIPYKTAEGTFAGSNLRVLEDGRLLAPPGFGVESGSISFGDVLTLSEASGFLAINNHLNNKQYTVVDYPTPRNNPSGKANMFKLTSAELVFPAQPIDTTTLTANPLVTPNYTVANTARTNGVTIRAGAAMTNVRFIVRKMSNGVISKYLPSKTAWEEGQGGLSFDIGDNFVDFEDTPLVFNAGDVIQFEFRATAINLKGNASGMPYFTATLQPGVFLDFIDSETYTPEDIRDRLSSLTTTERLSGTALKENVSSVNGLDGVVVLTKADVGLGNVDNTSDVNKPVSTATATAISSAITAHNAAVDPHPQYATTVEASAAAPVQSVNLLTGDVVLTTTNITEGGNLYYSDSRVTNYLTNNGYTVKSVASGGTGASVFNSTSVGVATLRAVNGAGLVTVTQNTNDITVAAPTITTGTYTPTLTNVLGVAASSVSLAQWMRVGNTVTVSGQITIDPTGGGSGNTIVSIGISLPIASDFSNAFECAGTAVSPAIKGQSAAILADAVANRASIQFESLSNDNAVWYYHYTYRII